ncbi:MAG TPA: TonB-dependent receptor [Candidatus Saccharimonadales bacterium]|nr:TonB-dependent receptor [Candidatus Saccharimonadales bacterium]
MGVSTRGFRVLAILFSILLLSSTMYGQTGTSGITGVITDEQGKAIPGAKVTLTNNGTNATRTTVTNDSGVYTFDLLPPADYRIEVEAKGFRKAVADEAKALIGKQTEVSLRLEIGTMSQTVEVSVSSQAVMNTQDASLGNVLESNQITQLPTAGRALIDLLSLQPGATKEGYVTGARVDQSNVTLDGVDVNNAQSGNAMLAVGNQMVSQLPSDRDNIVNGPVLRLNVEAIEEFRVTTANGNANQGHSSGSQINLQTKTGSNRFHGALFEFYRGTFSEANDWFSNAAGVPRTPLVRNTFGGALGGPVWKDKLFFFYSYEAQHRATADPVVQVVPLPNLGQGIINYSYCPDAACNSPLTASLTREQNEAAFADAGLNPAALAALADAAAAYPANDSTVGDGLNTAGYRFNSPTPIKLNSHVARLDYTINTKQSLFVRGNMIYDHQALDQYLPGAITPQVWNHPRGLAVGHVWTISNTLVNNLRYGFTRQAYTQGGDSNGNDISFRFVFQPNAETHSVSRTTPVHNITDDLSWIHGNHTFQFGVNFRKINNARVSLANAFDFATTNPSFYLGAGDHVSNSFQQYLDDNNLPGSQNAGQSLNSISEVQNAATAIIGRLSEYTADFTFGADGSLLAPGVPTVRNFATQSYDGYVQDAWKIKPHLTLTLGLRYNLEKPVYETKGFEVQPEVPLTTYFNQRLAAAEQGNNFTDPIIINKSGPVNGGKSMYDWDKNNFQPRIALAWSPSYSSGLLHSLFGDSGKSVIRGGFGLTNDYYGQALAVDFDLNNTLGFTSNYTTPANTYDSIPGPRPLAPLFTDFNQDVRTLPNVEVPPGLVFPLQQPSDEGGRIETSIDSKLHAPTEYVFNLTFERQFGRATTLSVSYVGRMARSLLARRDVAAFNNVRDPQSGMDWYTAGTMLEKQRQLNVDTANIASIPFFDNLFPANLVELYNIDQDAGFPTNWTPTQVFYGLMSRGGGSQPTNPFAFFAGNDWTDTEALTDQVLTNFGLPTRFMQPQYGALSAWSTIGNSNYHGLTATLRERFNSLTLDLNYTYSHSLDDASGIQLGSGFGTAFITNPIRQRDSYANSDFDVRHLVNMSAVWQLPFGRGKRFGDTESKALNAIIGGWQLSSIYRWNTGLPLTSPTDDARWATNWNVQAGVTPTSPVHTCVSRSDGQPKLFGGTGCDIKAIYQSFRNAYPGETGPRNYLRSPGYQNVDLGLSKSFTMPWSEKHQLQLRWDVFNVANLQRFGNIDLSRTGFGVVRDPALRNVNPPTNWSDFTGIQGRPREFEIGARYSF